MSKFPAIGYLGTSLVELLRVPNGTELDVKLIQLINNSPTIQAPVSLFITRPTFTQMIPLVPEGFLIDPGEMLRDSDGLHLPEGSAIYGSCTVSSIVSYLIT